MSLSGCELGQFVDAKPLFKLRYLVDDLEESLIPERFVFFLLEILTQRVVFMGRNKGAKGREQYGIFSRFVRAIHSQERTQSVGEFVAIGGNILQGCRAGQFPDLCSQIASSLVLRKEGVN